jgi:hypothetical protein
MPLLHGYSIRFMYLKHEVLGSHGGEYDDCDFTGRDALSYRWLAAFFRNFGNHINDYTASQPRRLHENL